MPSRPEIAGAVKRQRTQPGAKSPRATIVLETGQIAHHLQQDLLRQILGILLNRRVPPRPAANEWTVQLREPFPAERITRFRPLQDALMGLRLLHDRPQAPRDC